MKAAEIQKELAALGDSRRARFLHGFFKTGPGEYGDGDLFRGIRVPVIRKLAKAHHNLTLDETEKLLGSAYHEDRLLALLILVQKFSKGDDAHRAQIYDLYLKNVRFINNWNLVDTSAPQIVGGFLADKNRGALYDLARSSNLWRRRIAVMATFHFIKSGEVGETFEIARMLLSDAEDLIHKAAGWMLREAGKRDLNAEEIFLKNHYKKMPRVMLRYAVEKFPEPERRRYLNGVV